MEKMETGPLEAFADELGREFGMPDEEGREALRADLIETGPEEMADQFRRTAAMLEGLADRAGEFIGFGASRILVDARWSAERAREIAERHAR